MRHFLLLLLISISLLGCKRSEEASFRKYEYSDVSEKMIDPLEVFNDLSERYYIYYFQTSCYHCHGIKSKVISFSLEINEPFYFVEIVEDIGFLSHSKEETLGTNDPLKAFSLMTPQLSIVEHGYIVETYIGNEEILNIIES